MEFASFEPPPKRKPQRGALEEGVDASFVSELQTVALAEHRKKHEELHREDAPQLRLVQDSFSPQKIEGEISALLEDVEKKKLEGDGGEYKRIGAAGTPGGANYGTEGQYGASGGHGHGSSVTFEATCCNERIVAESTPSGRIKTTNLSEQVKQYQEQQTGGGGGGYGHHAGGGEEEGGGYQGGGGYH